jgi:beta-glucanase (GH16 family)
VAGTGGTTGGTGGAAGGTGGTAGGTAGTGGTVPGLEGVLGHPDAATTYPTYTGFTLKLVEEFAQPIDFATDPIWTWSDGGLPEGQVRFKEDGIKFQDGKMLLEVRTEFALAGESFAENTAHYGAPVSDKDRVSGEMRTKYNMFRYGRYEVRMKAPHPNPAMGNGNLIATLFVFRTPKFQDWREIDIEVTGESADSIWTNVIYGDNREGWAADMQEATKVYPSGTGAMAQPAGINSRTDFHNYAFEWTPTQIRWYVDDVLIRVKDDGVGDNNVQVPDLPGKIMMNLWIFNGGDFGGPMVNDNVYPFATEYEWFRFYQMDGEPYPCPDLSCLVAADLDAAKNNPDDGVDDIPEIQ